MSPHMTRQTASHLVVFIMIGMFILLAVVVYVGYTSYEGRRQLVFTQRLGCERSKLDRMSNAAFQRAHTKYINRVTSAKSVKEDVKRAAREAVLTFEQTSYDLSQRAKIDCKQAFPKASLIP